jgi:hypothetical protein
MAVTYDEAYEQITTRFLTQWAAGAPAILGVGIVPEIRFADDEKKDVPVDTFGRFVMNGVSNPQASLRNAEYQTRYENNGVIIIQLLVKRGLVVAPKQARRLAELAQSIFRDPTFPGCYIFQNTRIQNLDPEPAFLRKNIVTEYQFDELV